MKYCKRGHALTPENTRGGNRCRACGRLKHEEYAKNHPEKMREYKSDWKDRNREKSHYHNNVSETAKARKDKHYAIKFVGMPGPFAEIKVLQLHLKRELRKWEK